MLTMLIRNSKTNYYKNFFEEYKNDIKQTLKGIKTLINNKNMKIEVPTTMLVNNNELNDAQKISNEFNSYFSTIAEKTKAKIVQTAQNYDNYLPEGPQNSFFFRPSNEDEINKTIQSLDNSKATGPNSIHTLTLKLISPTISKHIANILNKTFITGEFPTCLKTSNIIPTFKKDSRLDLKLQTYIPPIKYWKDL